jgi:hypothetical protein
MIVGIDDAGDFKSKDLGMFAAVYIRPKKLDKIRLVFEKWENTLPDDCRVDGEVKGWKLNEKQIIDFAKNVIRENGFGQIRHQVFAIPINKLSFEALDQQRSLHVTQYREGVDMYRKQGKEFDLIAGQFKQMADWLESKSLKTLAKIELLGFTIYESFNNSIAISVLRGFDRELGKLTIKIDQGLVDRPSSNSYWRDTMRNLFWNQSARGKGMIHIREWKSNHPFLKRFMKYPKSRDKLAVFTKEIRECMNFYDSKDHFEIRIADIIASTYYRHYVEKQNIGKSIRELKTSKLGKGSFTIINVAPRKGPPIPNPYTDKIDGVSMDDLESRYSSDHQD